MLRQHKYLPSILKFDISHECFFVAFVFIYLLVAVAAAGAALNDDRVVK